MKENTKWIAYTELAWTEPIITPPSEHAKETELFSNIIKEHSKIEVSTLLQLGCGAGGNDYTFKNYFDITGLDISENMLEITKQLKPEVNYHYGDMRKTELGECFDSVSAPDSIGYMTTEEDLSKNDYY